MSDKDQPESFTLARRSRIAEELDRRETGESAVGMKTQSTAEESHKGPSSTVVPSRERPDEEKDAREQTGAEAWFPEEEQGLDDLTVGYEEEPEATFEGAPTENTEPDELLQAEAFGLRTAAGASPGAPLVNAYVVGQAQADYSNAELASDAEARARTAAAEHAGPAAPLTQTDEDDVPADNPAVHTDAQAPVAQAQVQALGARAAEGSDAAAPVELDELVVGSEVQLQDTEVSNGATPPQPTLADSTAAATTAGEAADEIETIAAEDDDDARDELATTEAEPDTGPTLLSVAEEEPVNQFSITGLSDTDGVVGGTVSENASLGDTVGIVAQASDADAGDGITYALTDSAGGRFAIDPQSGVVTVANPALLDFESSASHTVSVVATSTDGSSIAQSFTVAVGDHDEADVSAIADSDSAAGGVVSENASNGDTVGVTAAASDADGSDSVTYSLSDNAGGRFAIDATTGVVTVADASLLDHEAATSHTIEITATSTDGSTSTQSYAIAVNDHDEANVSAIADSDGAAGGAVSENASNGDTVGITAAASDTDGSDSVTYSLSDNAGGRFAIDANTGVVTVADASLLDFESATSHTIEVTATSTDGSTSTQSYTVAVSDHDEADVSAIADTDGGAGGSVSENASNGDTVGITAAASDADGSDSVTYSLSDNAGGRFAIDGTTGVVTVADASLLDHEAATSHTIEITATSTDGSTSTQSYTVAVGDHDEADVSAIADNDGAAGGAVSENASNGDTVSITATASDADGTDTVTYSLSDNGGGRFAIDANTGVVTVADASLLDFESATSHTIEVNATSTDGSTSTQSYSIAVGDHDEADVSAIADSDGAAGGSVSENASNGDTVGITAAASDADGSDSVTYSLSNNAGGRFAIDANTGVVTVADASLLDHEAATSHTIEITATSTDGSTSTQSYAIAVGDHDEADVSAIADSDGAAGGVVSENASNGDTVGITAAASDADGTDTVIYSLTDNAGGRFAIDANTGVVTVGDASLLDHETATSHTIEITATSTDGSTSTQSYAIAVGDHDEADVSAIADSDGAAGGVVSENASNGDTVGITAAASDADGSDSVTYSLSDNAGGRFAIDGTTGVVTVADASLLDHEA
ncbi:MAG: cadherin domain-containing protein, partial [Pseudomonadota bacterium]